MLAYGLSFLNLNYIMLTCYLHFANNSVIYIYRDKNHDRLLPEDFITSCAERETCTIAQCVTDLKTTTTTTTKQNMR